MTNNDLKKLVMSNLPIKDKRKIVIRGYPPEPSTNRNYSSRYIDVTKQVIQLLKEGKLKRIRKYGFGKSGNAGNTFFVENT